MIITCLMQMICENKEVLSLKDEGSDEDETFNSLEKFDEGDQERFKKGEFRIILQLLSVLQYGKLSKKLTDKAIDMCEHLQNLRSAIYDYKLRIEAADPHSKKHEQLKEVGLNYLVRYFYLITFADYLLETLSFRDNLDSELNIPITPFSEWLRDRNEIKNILRISNQSLD